MNEKYRVIVLPGDPYKYAVIRYDGQQMYVTPNPDIADHYCRILNASAKCERKPRYIVENGNQKGIAFWFVMDTQLKSTVDCFSAKIEADVKCAKMNEMPDYTQNAYPRFYVQNNVGKDLKEHAVVDKTNEYKTYFSDYNTAVKLCNELNNSNNCETITATQPKDNTAGSMLKEAAEIVEGSRQQTHGEKERSFNAIAAMWVAYLEMRPNTKKVRLNGDDVAHMMTLLKMVRAKHGTPDREHGVDQAGYSALAAELALKK